MKQSANPQVQAFLDSVAGLDGEKHSMLTKLRKIVFGVAPETTERMIYGGIMFSLTEDFGGLFVYKNHVSFEFGQGFEFSDPDNHLEGAGKFRRHLKLAVIAEIDHKQVEYFVRQAVCRDLLAEK